MITVSFQLMSCVVCSVLGTDLDGAALVKWISHSLCKPGVAGSIPGFSSLLNETENSGPLSI